MVNEKPPGLWTRLTGAFRLKEDMPEPTRQLTPFSFSVKPKGSYGTENYSGYASEEYLSSLRGSARADMFDKMRRADPQVVMCLTSVKNPIMSANWEVEAADDSDEAKADKELIEHILFHDMDIEWIDFVQEALTMIDFGHSVFEPIHKVVLNHKKFGSYNGIKTLAFRSQRTIERWNLDAPTGDLISVTQYAYGDLNAMVDIPSECLVVYSMKKEGANYEGISMLRPCYGPWYRKDNYLKLNAIGIEKFAVPTPIVEIPANKTSGPEFDNMIDALEHYLQHHKNYLTHPAGWKINLQSNAYDPTKVEASVDAEDKRMTKSFLANFLELGMSGGGGAYALGKDLSDFFLDGLDHIASKVASPINKKIIPHLIQMNRGQRDKYPRLKHSGISDKAGKELAELLKLYSDGRIITPDDVLEDHIRKRHGLPKASMEGRRSANPAPSLSMLAERILASERRKAME
jgi:phage gp29-like protein